MRFGGGTGPDLLLEIRPLTDVVHLVWILCCHAPPGSRATLYPVSDFSVGVSERFLCVCVCVCVCGGGLPTPTPLGPLSIQSDNEVLMKAVVFSGGVDE